MRWTESWVRRQGVSKVRHRPNRHLSAEVAGLGLTRFGGRFRYAAFFIFRRMGFVPLRCTWEITLACNLRCGHCWSRAGKARHDELDGDETKVLIDDLAPEFRDLVPDCAPVWLGKSCYRRAMRERPCLLPAAPWRDVILPDLTAASF